MIDLSKYVNKMITARLSGGQIKTGYVCYPTVCKKYPYLFAANTYTSTGVSHLSGTHMDIVEIINPKPKPEMTGLAQRQPNIDLSKFVGKTVLVKIKDPNNEYTTSYDGTIIGNLSMQHNDGRYYISPFSLRFLKSGTRQCDKIHIEEIYEEGAFSLTLKEIPEVDEKVEEVVKLAKAMTTEQIAEVIAKLKGEQ